MYLRGLAAEQQTDFGRARILYEECLHIAKPYRDALQRLAKLGTESGADGADGER
jgi:hypothetical protein